MVDTITACSVMVERKETVTMELGAWTGACALAASSCSLLEERAAALAKETLAEDMVFRDE